MTSNPLVEALEEMIYVAHMVDSFPFYPIKRAEEALAFYRQQGDTKTSALVWSREYEANETIRYNHVLADSPLGQFSIEWKGWKEHDSYCTYIGGHYLYSAYDLDEAKLIAEKYLMGKAQELFEFCRIK